MALAALLLWGGYGHHWSWTGINGHTATLWDWLKLTLLPLAFAVLPIWLRPDARLQHDVKVAALAAGIILAAVALGGYLVPWAWTGFRGNTLWDWLNLVALPLAVAVAPLWPEIRERLGAAPLDAGGHRGRGCWWSWFSPAIWSRGPGPGSPGTPLWDWLHLLVLPLLVPVVLIPTIKPVAEVPMTPVERPSPPRRAQPASPEPAAPVSTPEPEPVSAPDPEPPGPPPAG